MRTFTLKKTLGRSYNVDLDDVANVKRALNRLGYYAVPRYGMTRYPDEPMFNGIESFQSRYRLLRDGVMKPGGETAMTLGAVLAANEPPSEGGEDEGGNEDTSPPPLPDMGDPEPSPPSWTDHLPSFPENDYGPSVPILPGGIRG